MYSVIFCSSSRMRLLEQQGWHNHCSFQGYALQGRCIGIRSEHVCCLEYKCLPCFTRGDLEQIMPPVYNFFIAQVVGVDDIFAASIITNAHAYAHTYGTLARKHSRTNALTHTHTHSGTHTHSRTHTCTYTRTNAPTNKRMHTRTHAHEPIMHARTTRPGSGAWLFYSPRHVTHWWVWKCSKYLLQEARIHARRQTGPTLQHHAGLDAMQALLHPAAFCDPMHTRDPLCSWPRT